MTVKFESLNMIILKQSTKQVSNEYHYIRCILQRRLYATLTASYDNNSRKSLSALIFRLLWYKRFSAK